ncbi:Ca-activated chloride channel family protein [Paramicrobacterium humi]|uniref:Ca-activated chloride channel family protein n=1 Tax=Paramicrobacterium humi TaxID=640635 RepID=A0A1H4PIQ4_9MICO|nr:VWA domain-containing protein [Microbacterium humi]SEC07124.1 Ca-activated chloride channel family protein [Microbacterium humi]
MTFAPIMPGMLLLALYLVLAGFAIAQAVLAHGRAARVHWFARLAMVTLACLMALRPSLGPDGAPSTVGGDVDVYFVVDTTSSMAAEDWDGDAPRLNGVREDITRLVAGLAGARFSLVTFDAATVQRVPLTTDAGAIDQSVAALTQEITAYSTGSSISAPVDKLSTLLADDPDDHTTILYYLGDGEQTASESPESFSSLAAFIDGGAVLGYGTADGGRMREYLGYDTDEPNEYIPDPSTGGDAISHIDEDALGRIADELGVSYLHRDAGTSPDAALDGISVHADQASVAEPSASAELYWLLAIPFGLLAFVELGGLLVGLRELREPKGARDA